MDDIGCLIGGITFKWLEEKLIDFNCSINELSAEEIILKCNF